jgi:hypothetical protein
MSTAKKNLKLIITPNHLSFYLFFCLQVNPQKRMIFLDLDYCPYPWITAVIMIAGVFAPYLFSFLSTLFRLSFHMARSAPCLFIKPLTLSFFHYNFDQEFVRLSLKKLLAPVLLIHDRFRCFFIVEMDFVPGGNHRFKELLKRCKQP